MVESISLRDAQRIAIEAQGLAGSRPATAGRARVRSLAHSLGALQIDSVNVITRAHYLPPFARLGAYDQADLEAEAWGKKPSLFEYWGHAACLMPLEMQPLFRWRMAKYAARDIHGTPTQTEAFNAMRTRILAEVRARGAVTGGEFAEEKRVAGWWNWSAGKRALEWLFTTGELAIGPRRGFERTYDLPERVIPGEILNLPTPTEADAIRALTLRSLIAQGIGTESDIRDYYRTSSAAAKRALAELEESGDAVLVKVDGWKDKAWRHRDATAGRRGARGALLSPFDNMIWHRDRVERLFGIRFIIEIYTPADKRQHGYYVLMFLQGEAIRARVDLKSDRKAGVLRVQAAHLEPGFDEEETSAALAEELRTMAAWLGLGGVAIAKKGDLAAALDRHF